MATKPPEASVESQTASSSDRETGRIQSQTDGDAPEHLCLLNDTYARDILSALASEPQSGRALAENCDISRPTVYRRLNRLEAAGFVTTELSPDPDGHHRNEFHLVRDRLTVVIDDGSVAVTAHSRQEERS